MAITPLIIEPIKCFTFLLTVAEYLNTHLCPYLIYTGVDTHYKKQKASGGAFSETAVSEHVAMGALMLWKQLKLHI